MIKLVALDWNGTLFADMKATYEADNAVLKALGEKGVSYRDFLKHFDIPLKKYYMGLGLSEKKIDDNAELIQKTFHDYYEPRIQKVRTRANTRKILTHLKEQKIPAIIVSNHIKQKIIEQTDRLKITNYFDEILANDMNFSVMYKRAKQQRLAEYIEQKGFEKEEVLLVGDSIEEIQIAREIGALSVAITDGNCDTPRLKAAKPDYLISDLGSLESIISQINTA